jgi:DNA (cytosine-5)-methyltransferase 1
MGFDARWGVLGAADVGANHQRDRIWIVAKWRGQLPHTQHDRIGRWEQQQEGAKEANVANPASGGNRRNTREFSPSNEQQAQERQEGRIWQLDNASQSNGEMANTSIIGLSRQREHEQSSNPAQGRERQAIELVYGRSPDFWAIEPNVGRVADGLAARMDRLKAIGNGQVPLCAATAFKILSENL